MLKKIAYYRPVTLVLKTILSLFFDRKYLTGKFFEQKRMGYVWCLKSLSRYSQLKRQHIKFPVGKNTLVLDGSKITIDPSSLNVMQQPGCYFQAFEHLVIGKDVWIAPNVGIITANHDPRNPEEHLPGSKVVIGDKCWIGMNSVILPGVELGNNVTVGAGSVVTKSFKQGNCIIAGSPAKIIKDFN